MTGHRDLTYETARSGIGDPLRTVLGAVPAAAIEWASVVNASWLGGPAQRKLVIVVGGVRGARLARPEDILDMEAEDLCMQARAGGVEGHLVNILDVIENYDTDSELPVLFVEGDEPEILSIYLFELP